MVTLQITLQSTMGYKAMSTTIDIIDRKEYLYYRNAIQNKAKVKICAQRGMTLDDLKRFGYTIVRTREYNPEEIAREKAERYERIKQERGWK